MKCFELQAHADMVADASMTLAQSAHTLWGTTKCLQWYTYTYIIGQIGAKNWVRRRLVGYIIGCKPVSDYHCCAHAEAQAECRLTSRSAI